MENIMVSVIVPIYNAEKYLRQCLDSLLAQTMADLEFICVDNCSTDGSRAILAEYSAKDPRIKPVYQPCNMGQNHSMRTGLMYCSGEFIAECDSDDYVAPDMYQKLYEAAVRYNADVVQCGFVEFTSEMVRYRQVCTSPSVFEPMKLQPGKLMTVLGNQCHIMSALYRWSFIQYNNLWYREHGVYEDTSLSFKIRTAAKTYVMIPECLYFYRRDNEFSGSATITNSEGLFEQFEEIDRWNEEYSLGLEPQITVLRYYTYRWQLSRIPEEEKNQFSKRVAEELRRGWTYSSFFCTSTDYEDFMRLINHGTEI